MQFYTAIIDLVRN